MFGYVASVADGLMFFNTEQWPTCTCESLKRSQIGQKVLSAKFCLKLGFIPLMVLRFNPNIMERCLVVTDLSVQYLLVEMGLPLHLFQSDMR